MGNARARKIPARLIEDEVGSAISTMLLGLTLALVAGVPFGSWLGNATTWRMPFFVVAGLGLLSLAVLAAFMPRDLEFARPSSLLAQVPVLRHRRLTCRPCSPGTPASVSPR